MAENKEIVMDMQIPDSWAEFEKHVGFYDDKKIYTNGVRLVPTNRVNQWLEYIDRKNKHEKNKMAQVAEMFGKKLGEPFKIKDLMSEKIYNATFDNYGMRAYIDGFSTSWTPRRDLVMRLITGEAVIVDE